MAIGPVQLIVLGFPDPDFHGEIIDELERLRESDTVRVIDALAVYKDPDGEIAAMHLSNLRDDEATEPAVSSGHSSAWASTGRKARTSAHRPVPRRRLTASPRSPTTTPGTSSRTSPTARRRRSSCSSTTGRSGCATP
jgi:hypothetical protein